MFVVFLNFSSNKAAAATYIAGHNDWISKGFEDGVFQCVGSLKPAAGGFVLVHGESRQALEARINDDPFVRHDVVRVDIQELEPKRASPALEFLTA